jgi:hypothetical protein
MSDPNISLSVPAAGLLGATSSMPTSRGAVAADDDWALASFCREIGGF